MSLYITGVSRNAANSKPARDVIKKNCCSYCTYTVERKKMPTDSQICFFSNLRFGGKNEGKKCRYATVVCAFCLDFYLIKCFQWEKSWRSWQNITKIDSNCTFFCIFKKINSLCWDIETTMIIKKFNLFFSVLTATQALIWLNDIKEKISACGQECR